VNTIPFVFNYEAWKAMFPEFEGVTEPAAAGYFNLATLYVRNDGRGPVRDPNMQAGLLNLTTAHLVKLFSPQSYNASVTGGTEVIPLVGRVANASEGSVKIQVDMPDQQPNAAWWNQTPYGAAVWALMKPFRTMRFMPNPKRRIYNPPMRYFGFGTGI
jgi:hypothetical protein